MWRRARLLVLLMVFATPCFAPWAAHFILTYESGEKPALEILESSIEPDVLYVLFPVPERWDLEHKGFYVLTAQEPLKKEDLELRVKFAGWGHLQDKKSDSPQLKKMRAKWRKERAEETGIENAYPIEPRKVGGRYEVFLKIPHEHAHRSYIVYDHKVIFDKAAAVMDGGRWVTIDLPSFVKAYFDSK